MTVVGIHGHDHVHLFHVVHGLFQLGSGFFPGHGAGVGQHFLNGGAALQRGHVILGQGNLDALGGRVMSVAGKAALGDLRPVQNAQHVVRHRFVVGQGFLDLSAHFFAVERLVGQVDGGIGQRRPLQIVHHTGLAEKLGDHGLDLADHFFVRTFVGSRQLGQHLTDVLSGGIDGFVAQNGAVQIQAVAGHARGGAENVLAGQAQRQHSAAFALQKAHGQNVEQIFDRVHRRHIVARDQLKAVLGSGHGAQGQHGAQ